MGLAGTYRLVSCEMYWSDGQVEQPYGRNPEGLLVYTTGGYVSGHLMRRHLPLLKTGARRASAADVREAFLGYLGYYGTYEVDADARTVTHHVLGSWHPNWVGTDQVRCFLVEGDRLKIETLPIPSGERSYVTRLHWQRQAPTTQPRIDTESR